MDLLINGIYYFNVICVLILLRNIKGLNFIFQLKFIYLRLFGLGFNFQFLLHFLWVYYFRYWTKKLLALVLCFTFPFLVVYKCILVIIRLSFLSFIYFDQFLFYGFQGFHFIFHYLDWLQFRRYSNLLSFYLSKVNICSLILFN